MKTRLLNLWNPIRNSFWFVPFALVFVAIGLAAVMIRIDRAGVGLPPFAEKLLGEVSPQNARAVLSTIAGSMITVAGVAFSTTIVALSLASSQFGPRLLRNLMRDRGNQLALGAFNATFIYCLLVLATIQTTGDTAFVPGVSVYFAVLLALLDVGVLIYFIHHVSTSIQADNVIAQVYAELTRNMDRLFHSEQDGAADQPPDEPDGGETHAIAAVQSGYLQAIDKKQLIELARREDRVVRLAKPPGTYVVEEQPVATYTGAEMAAETLRGFAGCFITGGKRTAEQDAEFAIHQLVEVALRALSPGVNDPYTAMACIDHLGANLCRVAARALPSPCWHDAGGGLRVLACPVTFAHLVNTSFDQIRQHSRGNAAVIIRLLEALATVAAQARDPEQREGIRRQADLVERSSREGLPEEADQEIARQRYETVLEHLEASA